MNNLKTTLRILLHISLIRNIKEVCFYIDAICYVFLNKEEVNVKRLNNIYKIKKEVLCKIKNVQTIISLWQLLLQRSLCFFSIVQKIINKRIYILLNSCAFFRFYLNNKNIKKKSANSNDYIIHYLVFYSNIKFVFKYFNSIKYLWVS